MMVTIAGIAMGCTRVKLLAKRLLTYAFLYVKAVLLKRSLSVFTTLDKHQQVRNGAYHLCPRGNKILNKLLLYLARIAAYARNTEPNTRSKRVAVNTSSPDVFEIVAIFPVGFQSISSQI